MQLSYQLIIVILVLSTVVLTQECECLCFLFIHGLALKVFAMLSLKVKSAIQHARRSLPLDGNEAMAVAALLQVCETLQLNLKAAIKEDADWYRRFMPLTEEVNRAL
jgi:hypothetical protein